MNTPLVSRRAMLLAAVCAHAAAAPEARIHLQFALASMDLSRDALLTWIKRAAQAVTAFYGSYPVRDLRLEVTSSSRSRGVSNGKTFGERGAFIRIAVGSHSSEADLDGDWMLVHEMVHLGFPSVADNEHWMEEGSATYIEPIARVLIGNLTPARIWSDMVRDMPKGLPEPGEHGLNFTDTWASTYWGGALFWLLADVDIRKRTACAKGLPDAFRAIVAAGGNVTAEWPSKRALEIGDRATGVDTLQTLYDQVGRHRLETDLPGLWKDLGIVGTGKQLSFDDNAPLAKVRQAIAPSGAPDRLVAGPIITIESS